jgi:hypothetical protein
MEKIIHSLISNWIKGVDTYTHNGSTWLIFTDSKKWVIELTESKTLWYNYNFFKQIFEFTSLDVVDNQSYITQWVEDNVINKDQVNVTKNKMSDFVSDSLIRDGVRETSNNVMLFQSMKVEDTIKNGVKETHDDAHNHKDRIEGVIQNGVRDISPMTQYTDWQVEEIIENGVKETNHVDVMKFFDNKMEGTIQNGVKETQFNDNENKSWVEGVIKGGVKHTEIGWHQCNNIDDVIDYGVKEIFDTEFMPQAIVNDIIQNGVKETKTPGKDGDILSTIEWMEENKSNSYTKMIDDVIDNGIKETKHANKYDSIGPVIKEGKINDIIDNGVKVSGTFVGGNRQKENIESVIGYGTKNPTD